VVRELIGSKVAGRVGVFSYFAFGFGWLSVCNLTLLNFWVGVGLYWGALSVFLIFYSELLYFLL